MGTLEKENQEGRQPWDKKVQVKLGRRREEGGQPGSGGPLGPSAGKSEWELEAPMSKLRQFDLQKQKASFPHSLYSGTCKPEMYHQYLNLNPCASVHRCVYEQTPFITVNCKATSCNKICNRFKWCQIFVSLFLTSTEYSNKWCIVLTGEKSSGKSQTSVYYWTLISQTWGVNSGHFIDYVVWCVCVCVFSNIQDPLWR